MTKRYLTQQQQSRITKQQQKQVAEEGLLVAHYGLYVDVETKTGQIFRCNLRQNLGTVVVGDRVLWEPQTAENGILLAVLPRQSLLSRPIAKNKTKAIAANINQVLLVFAPKPKPIASVLDSYLVAIAALNLPAILVCNKSDLLTDNDELRQQIALYQHIGYPVLIVSAAKQSGLTELLAVLRAQTSILVGQSGVGKSSLLACIAPETAIMEKTASGDHGTHTTTTARLFHLPDGGDLIDSPGIREFTLWDMPAPEIAKGFIEFLPYLGNCKYRNCQHQNEIQCAIIEAVTNNLISKQRLASYHRIVSQIKH